MQTYSHIQLPRWRFAEGRKLDLFGLVIWSGDYDEVTGKEIESRYKGVNVMIDYEIKMIWEGRYTSTGVRESQTMVWLIDWRFRLNEGIVWIEVVERVPQHSSLRIGYVKSRSWRDLNC